MVLVPAVYIAWLLPSVPSVQDLREVRAAEPSVVLSADGATLASYRQGRQEQVTLKQVSPYVIKALIATEDKRFHEHSGVDFRRTLSAIYHTVRGVPQGGSTITQQLVRNLFPEEIGRSRNLNRKLKEMITALRIERLYSKEQILETYLNTVSFPYNVYGIEMAARTYYGKSAGALDALEAATLIGMLKGPHYYNPTAYPERVRTRRNLVLAQMVKDKELALADYRNLHTQPLRVSLNLPAEPLGEAPHFAAHVRKWLADWAEKNDHDLYTDGLVVHTTLDSKLQAAATRAVERQAQVLQDIADVEWGQGSAAMLSSSVESYAQMRKRTEPFSYFWKTRADLLDSFVRETPEYKKLVAGGVAEAAALARVKARPELMSRLRAGKTRIEAGFVALEPATGEVKAWVGSRDFQRDQYDHVAQAERQPGSTFKPFVYGAALEQGRKPESVYYDKLVEFRQKDGSVWRPTDMSGATGEAMTLRQGLTQSKNSITAQVMQDVGVPSVMNLAQAMGVNQSKLDPVPSMALGTSSVTLLEMVSAYATIAQLGDYRRPVFIKRITDRSGKVLAEFATERKRAMSPETAGTLIDIMRDVVTQGTGTAIRSRFGVVADVAGKTGTTQNNTDGWFILMHPNLVAGAWVGFNDARVTMRSNYWGQGGHNAILVVGDFFRDALKTGMIDAKAEFPRRAPRPIIAVTPENNLEPTRPEDNSAGLSNAGIEPGSIIVLERPVERPTLAATGRGTTMENWQRVDRLPMPEASEARN